MGYNGSAMIRLLVHDQSPIPGLWPPSKWQSWQLGVSSQGRERTDSFPSLGMIGLPVGKNHCTYDQECIELASLAREHVTNTGGEIQMWWPDAKFSNNQFWKGSGMHMQIGVYRVNSESRFWPYPTSIFTSQQTMTSFSPASTVLLDKNMWTLVEDWSIRAPAYSPYRTSYSILAN